MADKARKRERVHCSYDEVFTYRHFIDSYRKCLHGVSWKPSVQRYMLSCVRRTYAEHQSMMRHKLPPTMYHGDVVIRERGKQRIITPIHIRDRVVQKVLCDNLLTPLIAPHLIYDNGASLPGKGTAFSRERMDMHLREAIHEYGPDFYVLRFDFKSYFDSVPHETCRRVLERYIPDAALVEMTMDIIKAPYRQRAKRDREKLAMLDAGQGRGICLGSQVSQLMALVVPNDIDHHIKDRRRIRHYIRYMDDGVVLGETKEELTKLLEEIEGIAGDLGLSLNRKKTCIVKASEGFTFLKTRYRVTGTGKLIKRLSRDTVARMRRKLKRYRHLVDEGRMNVGDVFDSVRSWDERARLARSYRTRGRIYRLAGDLYGRDMEEMLKRRRRGKVQIDKWREHYLWSRDPGRLP